MTTAASPSGATIPIYDSVGNAWTVVSGVVQVNGAPAGTSYNVAQLLFYNGTIYQETTSRFWFSWSGTAWVSVAQDPRLPPLPPPPVLVESPSGTTVPPAASIIDASLTTWTVVNGVVQEAGKNAGFSENVTTLLFYNGVIWQEAANEWFSWNGTTWVGPSTDPRVPVVVTPPPPPPPPPPTGTAAALLAYIEGLMTAPVPTKHVLVMQHSSYWDANVLDYLQACITQTGQSPAGLGVSQDFVGSTENAVSTAAAFTGIIFQSWWPQWPNNATPGGTAYDASMNAADFEALTVPGTAAYATWQAMVATQIATTKAIGRPVILRPFVEMDGNWYPWGNQNPATFILLWQQLHAAYAAAGVTNVLWHFCPNGGASGAKYYPGAQYVDLVGCDCYSSTPGAAVAASAAALAFTGKPFLIGEAGVGGPTWQDVPVNSGNNNSYLESVLGANPTNFVGLCYGDQVWAISQQQGAQALMSNPAVITLSDLPAGI